MLYVCICIEFERNRTREMHNNSKNSKEKNDKKWFETCINERKKKLNEKTSLKKHTNTPSKPRVNGIFLFKFINSNEFVHKWIIIKV